MGAFASGSAGVPVFRQLAGSTDAIVPVAALVAALVGFPVGSALCRLVPRFGGKVAHTLPIQTITSIAFLAIVLRYGLSIQTIEFLLLTALLLVISMTDATTRIIPNLLVVLVVANRVMFIVIGEVASGTGSAILADVAASCLSSLVIALPLFLITLFTMRGGRRGALGGGDVKLVFAVGLYFPWWADVLLLLCACIIFVAFAVASRHGHLEKGEAFPFGPSIAAAALVTALFGTAIGRLMGFA